MLDALFSAFLASVMFAAALTLALKSASQLNGSSNSFGEFLSDLSASLETTGSAACQRVVTSNAKELFKCRGTLGLSAYEIVYLLD